MGIQERSTRFKETYCSCIAYIPVLIGGMQSAFPALLLPQLKREMHLSSDQLSWIASLGYFCLVLGPILCIFIIDKYGRKMNLRLIMWIFTIGWTIIAISSSFNNLLVGIILCAIASGTTIPLSTVYVTEISRTKYRGSLLSMVWLFNVIGSSTMYSLEYHLKWRMAVYVVVALTIVGQLLFRTIPESKYWYMIKGNKEEAKQSANWFENSPVVRKEVDIIYSFIKLGRIFDVKGDSDKSSCPTTFQALKNVQVKPFILALTISILRCGTGKVLFTVYPVNMFNDMHTPYNSILLSVWYNFLNFISCFANILVYATVDRFNRKNYFYFLSTLMLTALTIIIILDTMFDTANVMPRLRLISMYIYLIAEGTGYFCITSIIVTEVIPIMQRSIALPLNFLFTNIVLAYYIKVFPDLEHQISFRNLCLFFLFNIAIIMYLVHEYVPETKGQVYFGNMGTLSSTMSNEGLQDGQFDKMMKEDWFRNEEVQAFFTSNDLLDVNSLDVEALRSFNKQWLQQAKEILKTNETLVDPNIQQMFTVDETKNLPENPFDMEKFGENAQKMFESMKQNLSTPWSAQDMMTATNKAFKEQQKWLQKMFPSNVPLMTTMPSMQSMMPGFGGETNREDKARRKANAAKRKMSTGEKIV